MRRAANRQTDGEGEKSVGESREGAREEWAIIEIFCPFPSLCAVSAQRRKREGGGKKSLDVVVGTTKLSRGGKGEKEKRRRKRRRRKVPMAKSVSLLLLLPAVIAQRRRRRRNDSGEKVFTSKKAICLHSRCSPTFAHARKRIAFYPFHAGKMLTAQSKKLNFSSWPFPSTFLLFFILVYSKLEWAKKKGELHPWTLEIFLSSSSSCGMCAS